MMKKYVVLLLLVLGGIGVGCGTASTSGTTVQYPVVLEIAAHGSDIDQTQLWTIFERYGVDSSRLYSWGDRWLVFDFASRELAAPFEEDLGEVFPEAETSVYDAPYYVFDRSNCNSGQIEGPWAHKILTANLVEDPTMQQEYMDYHANQFEQFPEVSAGFCRAEFQQLIMYRNGRQLMLIISYPAGKDYDTLNARTVENNPRVDEWNSIMAKYQEGIEGTQPGETWVFFTPVAEQTHN